MPATISDCDAQYAHDLVSTICARVGPGLPGSPQERARAAIFERELAAHLGAGNVAVEEFSLAPGALVDACPLSALLMLLAVVLNLSAPRLAGTAAWLAAVAALALAILAPAVFILQFVFNRELMDRFLPKKQSQNVIGTLRRPGTGPVKRLLILSGHHDSAPANTWFTLLGNVQRLLVRHRPHDRAREQAWLGRLGNVFYFLSVTWFLGYVVLLAASLVQVAGLIAGHPGLVRFGTLGWVLLAYPMLPAIVVPLFFTHGRKNGGLVPGAADNLAASAIAVAMCRFLVENPSHIPDGTEIRFISFGGEEAGLRGSRQYVRRHLAELQALDARVLNVETVGDPEIAILTAEGNGTVKCSADMVKSLVAAAERAGVPHRTQAPWLGAGGDAAPFSQAGFRATTVMGFRMPHQAIEFYHQKWDSPEIVTLASLSHMLKLADEWIRCGGE